MPEVDTEQKKPARQCVFIPDERARLMPEHLEASFTVAGGGSPSRLAAGGDPHLHAQRPAPAQSLQGADGCGAGSTGSQEQSIRLSRAGKGRPVSSAVPT